MADKICVAILNASPELMEVVAELLEGEGFATTAMAVHEAKKHPERLRELYRDKNPAAGVCAIALPYEESWRFLLEIQQWPESKDRHFVVTSTNPTPLAKQV